MHVQQLQLLQPAAQGEQEVVHRRAVHGGLGGAGQVVAVEAEAQGGHVGADGRHGVDDLQAEGHTAL